MAHSNGDTNDEHAADTSLGGAKMQELGNGAVPPVNAKQERADSREVARAESSGSESEDDTVGPGNLTASERRKKQNLTFKALLSKRAESITENDIKQAIKVAKDSELSMASLMAKQDFVSVIHDPREYQLELFERAKEKNIIAVLDTGAGKTLIAVLLLQHTVKQEMINRANGEPHKISFFLVDSVPLVYQQAAVLENNIDQKIAKFCGAMGTDFWNSATWTECFQKNMIIVCTAEVLLQCLLRSFIRMEQINLLVFDEVHHAKKDHPYARIVKLCYMREPDLSKRPKLFGMTASPLDAKVDVVKAARELEVLLNSQIATASNPQLLRQSISRPTEETWVYERLDSPFETELYTNLHSHFGDLPAFEKHFRFAFEASSSLGAWCSDQIWSYVLTEDVLPKIEARSARQLMRNMPMTSSAVSDSETQRIRAAGDMIRSHEFKEPRDDPGLLSPKVRRLYSELSRYFERRTDTKCIVFTEKRHTARVLADLFSYIHTPHLRPGWLIGSNSKERDGANLSFRQQFMTLLAFRKGELNCLFATSVGEEGLDIQDCNLVIRFDLYSTLIQYVQSRGRARHANSTFAHMVERDNLFHEARVYEVKREEELMARFCASLPEDRILHGADELDEIFENDRNGRSYRIDSTGATLTFHSSLAILAHYASSLQYEKEVSTQVHYYTRRTNEAFFCDVVLPEKSPVRGQTGKPASKKSLAKQSAAFETCLLLRKHGLLDEHFVSTYHRRLPAMRNARLAITSKKTNQYDMIVKPKFWTMGRGTVPGGVYATIMVFRPSQELSRQHRSLVMFTREPLPTVPHFCLFVESDIETKVECTPLSRSLLLSEDRLDLLTTFTLRIFQDVFHKMFDREPHMMSYWLAPARLECTEGIIEQDPDFVVDWDTLRYVQENEELVWTHDKSMDFLADRFVVDKWDGRYRYFTTGVEAGKRPSDPPAPSMARRRNMDNIMNYCLSLFKNARVKFLATCDWNQPVVNAELVQLRRNLLDRMTQQERQKQEGSSSYYICPEPLKISSEIPPCIATSAFTLPALITRIESYLVALETCEMLQLKIPAHLALEALTKDSDNSDEHTNQQVNFKRGMGNNYERLEFLGDCFLKMATSISLFAMNPDNDEFDSHVQRMCLVCNQNLFNTAIKLKLYEFIRTQGFSRRTWYPEGLKLLQGKAQGNDSPKHALADKTIADVCEALIGASLLAGGRSHRFDMAVKAVSILVDSKDHDVSDWEGYTRLYSLPGYQTRVVDVSELDLARQVEEELGYHFEYPTLLRSAFTHPSYPPDWARVPCYQRLEFLGDSLLDMVCVEYLYQRYPDKDPQWLTEHKIAMVSNKFLGSVAVRVGMHRHLNKCSNPLNSQISDYAEEIAFIDSEPGQSPDSWTNTTDPPKCLADMVEAYVGAIFVDSNFRLEVVEDFFNRFLQKYFRDLTLYDTYANKHPTTHLHNRLSIDFGCEDYCLKAGQVANGDSMAPERVLAAFIIHNRVVAEGVASSARYAKVAASKSALDELEGLPPFKFRERYGCDCRIGKDTEEHGKG